MADSSLARHMRWILSILLLVVGTSMAEVTYREHVRPILRDACFNCHNPDKSKADLDLTTMQLGVDL